MPIHYDYCVIGAGLAGLHVAIELAEQGVSVCVVDSKGIASGASGTPAGLANPATGRFASQSWRAEESLEHLSHRLLKASSFSNNKFFKQTGILRPALDEKIASKMKHNLNKDSWSDDTTVWLDQKEVQTIHPGIQCIDGGVWVPKGLTVFIPEYLLALRAMIEQQQGIFYLEDSYRLIKNKDWEITFDTHQKISSKNIVFTSGIWTSHSEYWSNLKMHAVKGQILILKTDASISFDHAVSALGYFSKIDTKRLVYGSTYEHRFDHHKPDQNGRDYMLKRFQLVVPDLAKQSSIIGDWAGIRASTPDRKPYIGSHQIIEHCFVFTGLGSKGLLYSSIGAHLLVEHIINDAMLPAELDFTRFNS